MRRQILIIVTLVLHVPIAQSWACTTDDGRETTYSSPEPPLITLSWNRQDPVKCTIVDSIKDSGYHGGYILKCGDKKLSASGWAICPWGYKNQTKSKKLQFYDCLGGMIRIHAIPKNNADEREVIRTNYKANSKVISCNDEAIQTEFEKQFSGTVEGTNYAVDLKIVHKFTTHLQKVKYEF